MKNFEYKKSLGQNFLIDNNIIKNIMNSIDIKNDTLIIEIGPGSGNLTKELVNLNSQIICFEIDERLKSSLDILENGCDNLKIYYQDFLSVNLKEILSNYSYKHLYFIANIPYYITNKIVNKIHSETDAEELILMVQKEVGNRFMAVTNTKDYGSLSVFLQYNYDISKVCNVPKTCFYPIPKVDSTIIKFVKKENKRIPNNEEAFYQLIKDSFTFKRKNLRNNLKNYDLKIIDEVLQKHNKDLTYRAEAITVDEFIDISNRLN